MWYFTYTFPSFYFFNFYWYILSIKTNQLRNFSKNKYLFNKLNFTISLVNMRSSYNFLISQILDILINLFEILPVMFKIKFRYRRSRYIEIFLIRGRLNRTKKSFFKLLNELIVFLFANAIRKFQIVFRKASLTTSVFMDVDLKTLNYFAKFLPLRYCVIMNVELVSSNFFNFYASNFILFKRRFFNLLKNGFKSFS